MAHAIPDDSIFSAFNIHHATYKTISTTTSPSAHPIRAAILTPKTLTPSSQPHPLAINIHGGYLVSGHRTFAPFFHPWLLHLALTHSAVLVAPDYRLLPSSGGLKDVNADLEDFWAWVRGEGFRAALAEGVEGVEGKGVEVDLGRTLLVGGSAGGYGAVQLGIGHPEDIKVLAAFYPMVDLRASFWVDGPGQGRPTPMRMPVEGIMGRGETERWIAEGLAKGEVVSEGGGFEMFAFGAAVVWNGLFWKVFDPRGEVGTGELPVERLREGGRLPGKVWVVHGSADSAVPIEDSQVFTSVVKEKLPEVEVRFDVGEGQDHGFDSQWAEDDAFSRESLAWLTKSWLS